MRIAGGCPRADILHSPFHLGSTQAAEEEPVPVPVPVPLPKTRQDARLGTQTPWAITLAAAVSSHITLTQEPEDRRAYPPLRVLGGGQGTGTSREETWLQAKQLAKRVSAQTPTVCARETQRRCISKGRWLQDTGGEAPLCLEPSRTSPDNHSTTLFSRNTGNSMALWQVKLPTFLLCSRDKVVANDTEYKQPTEANSCYIFASLIFFKSGFCSKGSLSAAIFDKPVNPVSTRHPRQCRIINTKYSAGKNNLYFAKSVKGAVLLKLKIFTLQGLSKVTWEQPPQPSPTAWDELPFH